MVIIQKIAIVIIKDDDEDAIEMKILKTQVSQFLFCLKIWLVFQMLS